MRNLSVIQPFYIYVSSQRSAVQRRFARCLPETSTKIDQQRTALPNTADSLVYPCVRST
jgi:hypothetical protein